MADVYNRRRQAPGARREAREAITNAPLSPNEQMQQITNLTRRDSPEYRDYLAKGSKASGRMTATQTGAKKMAGELGIEQITRARKNYNDRKRARKAAEQASMS